MAGPYFNLKEVGNLAAACEADRRGFSEATWKALKVRADAHLKGELRRDVEQSGMRNAKRLAKTWRGDIYPKAAKAHAARPSYVATQKTDYLAGILQTGGVIRAKDKAFPVPLDAARKFMRPGVPHDKLIGIIEAKIGHKLIARRGDGGRILLGDETIRGKKQKRVFIAYFVLKREVQSRAKLHSDSVFAKFSADLDRELGPEIVAVFETDRAQRVR